MYNRAASFGAEAHAAEPVADTHAQVACEARESAVGALVMHPHRAVTVAVSLGKRNVDLHTVFRDTRVGKHFAGFLDQLVRADRVPR